MTETELQLKEWAGRQRFYTTEEFAELVRARPETVRYWRQVGSGPKSFRLPGSRRRLYAAEDVEAFIAAAQAGAV